ncbi:MAG: AAA family ATPase [Leucobacter sp.]
MLETVGGAVLGLLLNEGVAASRLHASEKLQLLSANGQLNPTAAVKRLTKELRNWAVAERIPEDSIIRGASAAQEVLKTETAFSPELLISAGGEIDGLVNGWARRLTRYKLEEAETSVAIAVFRTVTKAILQDPKFAAERGLQILAYLAKKVIPPANPNTISAVHFALARYKPELQIQLYERDREFPEKNVEWPKLLPNVDFDWLVTAHENLNTLASAARADGFQTLEKVANQLSGLTTSVGLQRALRDEDGFGQLRSLPSRIVKRDAHRKASSSELRKVREAVGWLQDQARYPRHQAILPLQGSWGSGKTALAHSVAKEALEAGWAVIFFPSTSADFASAFLAAAAESFGRTFSSIQQLRHALQSSNIHCLVVIDDLDEWVERDRHVWDAFREEIQEQDGSGPLRWLVTADSTALDLLHSPDAPRFWRQEGHAPPSVNTLVSTELDRSKEILATGWLDLDEIVVAHRIGHMILFAEVEGSQAKDLRQLLRADKRANELLCRPRPAHLYADAMRLPSEEGGMNSAFLSEASFLNSYWERAIEMAGRSRGEREGLHELAAILAEYFALSNGEPVERRAIQRDYLGSNISVRERDILLRQFAALESASLIHAVGRSYAVSAELLWGGKVAAWLDNPEWITANDIEEQLRPWLRPAANPELGRYVVRARVEVLGRRQYQEKAVVSGWRGLLSRDESNAVLWMAALTLPRQHQSAATRELVGPFKPLLSTGQDEFSLFYWMIHAEKGVWSTAVILELLQNRFSQATMQGLDVFLLRAVDRALSLLEERNRDVLSSTLRALEGSDSTRVGPHVAALFISRCAQEASVEDILRTMAEFFHSSNAPVAEKLNPDTAQNFFRTLLWDGIDLALSRDFDLAATILLDSTWSDGSDSDVTYLLLVAARVRIGHFYARNRNEVRRLVNRLAHGTKHELTSAFFIIRHSVPTSARKSIQVEEGLYPALDIIQRRREEFTNSMWANWVFPLLKANPRTD